MSRQADERQYRKPKGQTKQGKGKAVNVFVFRPTKEVKEKIKDGYADAAKNLGVIGDYTENGNKVSFGHAGSTGAIWGTIRAPGEDWKEAPAVTAWHSNLGMVVAQLAYYLAEVNPEFPDGVLASGFEEENDW